MTSAIVGDVAKSAFCASLVKNLYLDCWSVRDELENLVVWKDNEFKEVEEEMTVVPTIEFPEMFETSEEKMKRRKREEREKEKARKEKAHLENKTMPA